MINVLQIFCINKFKKIENVSVIFVDLSFA